MNRPASITTIVALIASSALAQQSDMFPQAPSSIPANSAPANDALHTPPDSAALLVPPDILAELADVKDYQLTFEGRGFEALLAFIKRNGVSRACIDAAPFFDDWRSLFERPASLRGSAVTIEGVVGRNKSWSYADPERKALFGNIWQLEITQRSSPLAATLILTRDANDIAVDSTIRVTGYFLAVRHYLTSKNELRPALLIVAEGPNSISRNSPPPERESRFEIQWVVGTIVAALAAAWILIRWTGRGGRTDIHTLRASHSAPADLSHDLEKWAGGPENDGR